MSEERNKVMLVSLYGVENRGVRLISAVLRRHGFEPHIIFFKTWVNNRINAPSEREKELLCEHAKKLNPLLIGMGVGTPYLKIAVDLTARLKRSLPCPILWGGVHPTICPEDCVAHADIVCVGEGEYPTLDLCQSLASGAAPTQIPNLWFRRGTEIVRNPIRPLAQDLDAIPFPDYLQPGFCLLENNRLVAGDPIRATAEYRIYPTRGCPYQCAYCHNNSLREIYSKAGRYYRIRGPENVVNEIRHAKRVLPRIRRVKFDGDVFAFPKPWIEEFCRRYAAEVKIPFELLTYPGELDTNELTMLKNAGLAKIQTGVQSGSDREVREDYGRTSTAGDIRALSKSAHEAGVEIVYDLIFDNPLSGDRDKREMIELLLSLERPFRIYLYSLTVFPKSKMASVLLEKGLITPEQIEGHATKSFRQFRLSFDYPRPKRETFWISLAVLTSKSFVPRAFVRACMNSPWLMSHPLPLRIAAQLSDLVKNAFIALEMLARGELTWFKIRQYGGIGKIISQ